MPALVVQYAYRQTTVGQSDAAPFLTEDAAGDQPGSPHHGSDFEDLSHNEEMPAIRRGRETTGGGDI